MWKFVGIDRSLFPAGSLLPSRGGHRSGPGASARCLPDDLPPNGAGTVAVDHPQRRSGPRSEGSAQIGEALHGVHRKQALDRLRPQPGGLQADGLLLVL